MKRVLTIQDISGIGKCSLTEALPIISAAGIECAVLPTTVLSTHTAFEGFTFHDLTDDMPGIADHWAALGMEFSSIYTGYLGSIHQVELVEKTIDRFRKEDTLVVVDPAMADNGKLYAGFAPEFVGAMKGLCAKADVVVPNITEAAFLLGEEYIAEGYTEDYVKRLLKELTDLGPRYAVLTGVSFSEEELGGAAYDKETGAFFTYFTHKEQKSFHGTGDLFASALVGALENGFTIEDGIRIAAEYTLAALQATLRDPEGRWYGVNFEEALPVYLKLLGKI
ncbi:MAG: pyridoxamine kinase [Clostridia bacterium]|nr:pyridoxamine kinase [Clostridia bacterium]MBQ6526851.1 pyridoxamine kinase [Clostridia bacterium]